ncbi:MAG: hypothetical protein QOG72_2424 [Sphingomonadales bacterium]|jgi:hypothetical protein|nr:hypothetical protein [Sphingomonadales bacterium]
MTHGPKALATPAPVGEEAVEREAVLWAREDWTARPHIPADVAAKCRAGAYDELPDIAGRVRAYIAGRASVTRAAQ